jgi:hypothetical protein
VFPPLTFSNGASGKIVTRARSLLIFSPRKQKKLLKIGTALENDPVTKGSFQEKKIEKTLNSGKKMGIILLLMMLF